MSVRKGESMAKLSFNEYYEILLKKTEEIKSELENIIICDVENIPFLDEIKDSEIRYKSYSNAVKINLQISRILSNAYFTKDAVLRVKQKVQKDVSVAPSRIVSSWIKDIDCLCNELENILLSAKSYKEGLDHLLRFYQSACYMFGGMFEVKSSV